MRSCARPLRLSAGAPALLTRREGEGEGVQLVEARAAVVTRPPPGAREARGDRAVVDDWQVPDARAVS